MKFIYVIAVTLALGGCGESSSKDKIITIDPKSIQTGEVIHDSLSQEQIQKIKKIHSAFEDVYPLSLEEATTNFKRDMNPDKEIDIWLKMVSAYENYFRSRKDTLDLKGRKEVFALVLSRTMMPPEEAIKNARLQILSKEEANKILSFYNSAADSMEVIQK